jgi:hypothetical protein
MVVGCGSRTASPALSPPPGSSASSTENCPQTQSAPFDKTTFVFHAGLGFGAFHHFIYRPFRSGGFAPGTPGRGRRLIEAGLATIPTPQQLAHPA